MFICHIWLGTHLPSLLVFTVKKQKKMSQAQPPNQLHFHEQELDTTIESIRDVLPIEIVPQFSTRQQNLEDIVDEPEPHIQSNDHVVLVHEDQPPNQEQFHGPELDMIESIGDVPSEQEHQNPKRQDSEDAEEDQLAQDDQYDASMVNNEVPQITIISKTQSHVNEQRLNWINNQLHYINSQQNATLEDLKEICHTIEHHVMMAQHYKAGNIVFDESTMTLDHQALQIMEVMVNPPSELPVAVYWEMETAGAMHF